ncbi:class E sortase [Streptomyces sp. NPDC002587]
MRDHMHVVVQGRGGPARRVVFARALWVCAEVITTVGVVVALLVVHQVWWTNRQAVAGAREQVRALESEWAGSPSGPARETSGVLPSGGPSAPSGDMGRGVSPSPPRSPVAPATGEPGSGSGSAGPARDKAYAVLRVPRLGLVVPVAQGVGKRAVLDKGYAGQYPGTARPGERGNFALAGHRNTHGEPFRYINRLRQGDELIVDVQGRRYVYVVGKVLNETTERDTGVIAPVPRSVVKPDQGYGEPDAYITLTTCTPEYTSKYRLVVWGTLTS